MKVRVLFAMMMLLTSMVAGAEVFDAKSWTVFDRGEIRAIIGPTQVSWWGGVRVQIPATGIEATFVYPGVTLARIAEWIPNDRDAVRIYGDTGNETVPPSVSLEVEATAQSVVLSGPIGATGEWGILLELPYEELSEQNVGGFAGDNQLSWNGNGWEPR